MAIGCIILLKPGLRRVQSEGVGVWVKIYLGSY